MPRTRLLRRLLDERNAAPVALIAPAGFGKSSLLAEWAAADERPFAWLSLTTECAERDGLLRAIGQRLRSLQESVQPSGHATRRLGDRVRAQQETLNSLLDVGAAIEASGQPVVLVLDELDHVQSQASLQALSGLIRRLPPSVQLAFASRRELALGLGRLHMEDRLIELRAEDLAMTEAEARKLLSRFGGKLDLESLQSVIERAEGWPAAIQLAGVWLRDGGDTDRLPLSGADYVIAGYVREEILAHLSTDRRMLLRQVSILDHLSAELCDAVLDRHSSGAALQELASEGILSALEHPRGAYRLRRLLRDVLRAELELREPDAISQLHSRASATLAAKGASKRALHHAAKSGDSCQTAHMLWEAPALICELDGSLERSLRSFSGEQLAACPQLTVAGALNDLFAGNLTGAKEKARLAADALLCADPSPDDDSNPARKQAASIVQGGIALIEAADGLHGVEHMAASAERASELLGGGCLQDHANVLRGVAMHLLGQRTEARPELESAAESSSQRTPTMHALALTQLALMDIEDEDWESAQDRVTLALTSLRASASDALPIAALSHALCALVMGRVGIADEAKRELRAASRLLHCLESYMPWYEVEARIVMARASARLADVTSARALLSQASRHARRPHAAPCFVEWLDGAWGEVDDACDSSANGAGSLTIAELRVLRFLPTHLSFREIGERLHVSSNTVKSQAHSIYAKLGSPSRSEAVAQAARLGLIDPPLI